MTLAHGTQGFLHLKESPTNTTKLFTMLASTLAIVILVILMFSRSGLSRRCWLSRTAVGLPEADRICTAMSCVQLVDCWTILVCRAPHIRVEWSELSVLRAVFQPMHKIRPRRSILSVDISVVLPYLSTTDITSASLRRFLTPPCLKPARDDVIGKTLRSWLRGRELKYDNTLIGPTTSHPGLLHVEEIFPIRDVGRKMGGKCSPEECSQRAEGRENNWASILGRQLIDVLPRSKCIEWSFLELIRPHGGLVLTCRAVVHEVTARLCWRPSGIQGHWIMSQLLSRAQAAELSGSVVRSPTIDHSESLEVDLLNGTVASIGFRSPKHVSVVCTVKLSHARLLYHFSQTSFT